MYKQHNAVNVKFECQCKIKHIARKCVLYYAIWKLKHRIYQENTKSPTDPVYLDKDQSLVNRKQSHSDQKMLFSTDVHPRLSTGCTRIGSAFMPVINTGHHSKDVLLFLLTKLYNRPSTYPSKNISGFQWWFTDISTLGVKYAKQKTKKLIHRVSCIRILDYKGSKLEAQMTLGHFYLVHHSNFTYNIITEIKRALHNRVLLPHVFSFQDYGDNEHKPTDHEICISQRHLRYRVP